MPLCQLKFRSELVEGERNVTHCITAHQSPAIEVAVFWLPKLYQISRRWTDLAIFFGTYGLRPS